MLPWLPPPPHPEASSVPIAASSVAFLDVFISTLDYLSKSRILNAGYPERPLAPLREQGVKGKRLKCWTPGVVFGTRHSVCYVSAHPQPSYSPSSNRR